MVVCIWPSYQKYTETTKTAEKATTSAFTISSAASLLTKSVELMGPWYIIGALLLLLSARVGESTNKIIIPQQIGSNIVNTNVANGGMHHHLTKTTSITTTGNKGTVVSGNGVIVAGGSMHSSMGPSS